nr:zinc finger protein 777-like [Lytechinus pictus]
MHPKLKNFMRTEAMECEIATSQTATPDAAGAIENASGPQEMAATVAATPSDPGAIKARLAEETPCPLQGTEAEETQKAVPKLRRSRNSKKGSKDQGDEDYDTDDELQWCSKGIAVFLSPEDENEKKGGADEGDSMEVDLSRRLETLSSPEQEKSKSMLACFKPKPKCSSPSQLYPCGAATGEGSQIPLASGVPSMISLSAVKPSIPVTLASKPVSPPSIPHTYTPANDIDMDTGESMAMAGDTEEDQLKKCRQFVKLELPESKKDCHVGLVGNASMYAHYPFTLMDNLPLIVKTEPSTSPSLATHLQNTALTGHSFITRASGQSNGLYDLHSPIANLPPMPLGDFMRMSLNQHVLSLHGQRPHSLFQKPKTKVQSVGTTAKMFTCPQCGATFKHRHHVVRHMRAHTGEKPFRCEECGAMFARKCILTNHIRTHTGEKPYVCGECGDAFSRKHHLVIHRRTHTGEKPYVCPFCPTAFARSHHLNRHLKTHYMPEGHLNRSPLHPDQAINLPEHVGAVAVDLSIPRS